MIHEDDNESSFENDDDKKSWHKQQTPNPEAQGAALDPPCDQTDGLWSSP